MRKDLGDGSLQGGKDYWQLEDWNTTFPTSAKWSKKWVKEINEEKEGNFYWREWDTIARDWHY